MYNFELPLDPHSILNLLLELDIALVLHESGVPWHILLMVRQLRIELAMCHAVERHPLKLTVSVPLIGIKESDEPGMSEIVYAEIFIEMLTETPGPSTSHRQVRSRMPKPTCPCLDPTSVAWARWRHS